MLDISNVYRYIRHLRLKEYSSPFPIIFLAANDPDDACKIVFDNLITLIIGQEPSIDMRIVCRKIKRKSRIDKIYAL